MERCNHHSNNLSSFFLLLPPPPPLAFLKTMKEGHERNNKWDVNYTDHKLFDKNRHKLVENLDTTIILRTQ